MRLIGLFYLLFVFIPQNIFAQSTKLGETDVPWVWDKTSPLIHLDQFGYLPSSKKVAVLANPEEGQNKHLNFVPSEAFQVLDKFGNITYEGKVKAWNGGAIHKQSGDQVWYADFSKLVKPGIYRVVCGEQSSPDFEISEEVYNQALKAAVRFFYYQRSGVALQEDFAGKWTRPENLKQQTKAEYYYDFLPRGKRKDISGGWFDAGDLNKYVPFISTTIFRLFEAYNYNPEAFTDDFGIPESGNGVPDILDELKWELDWLLKMQNENGGFHNRVGHRCGDYKVNSDGKTDEPQYDEREYFYTKVTTWATAVGGASVAKAAPFFRRYNSVYPNYAERLEESADRAWAYLEQHPNMYPEDGTDGAWHGAFYEAGGSQEKKENDLCHGGGASLRVNDPAFWGEDLQNRLWFASEMLHLKNNKKYANFFEANWKQDSIAQWGWRSILEGFSPTQACDNFEQACMNYLKWDGANESVKQEIKKIWYKGLQSEIVYPFMGEWDAYRSYMPDEYFNWNSGEAITSHGGLLVHAIEHGLSPSDSSLYQEIAESYLHRQHGQNPLGLCFMTNSESFGADKCTMQIFGKLWGHLTPNDQTPPPGYILSGVNQSFNLNSGRQTPYDWLNQEPPQKAYYPINTGWPVPGWELGEPALYTQSAYILLLSYFAKKLK